MPYPFVIKPVSEGSSVGVYIIKDDNDLANAKKSWKYGRAIVEKYIEGAELSVAVIDTPLHQGGAGGGVHLRGITWKV